MKIQIEITGILRRPSGQALLHLELAEPHSASEVIALLGYTEAEQRALRLSRNGQVLAPNEAILEGDQLMVFAAIGGG